ncbi:MAG TPA: methyltransferase domain-containing protein [Rhodocyclaceae bacterium]
MPGYEVKVETVRVGGVDFTIRSLLDLQQFSDPEGAAGRAGFSAANWSLFGHIWPSSRVLALAMQTRVLAGKRVLELGAGLALSSLVIQRRLGDVTASDAHPLAPAFLNENLSLNGLLAMNYQVGSWADEDCGMGLFDLIIGSDVLYERSHPAQLVAFIARHSAPTADVLIVDPDRENRARFCQEMKKLGYGLEMRRAPATLEDGTPYKGRFLEFHRGPSLQMPLL